MSKVNTPASSSAKQNAAAAAASSQGNTSASTPVTGSGAPSPAPRTTATFNYAAAAAKSKPAATSFAAAAAGASSASQSASGTATPSASAPGTSQPSAASSSAPQNGSKPNAGGASNANANGAPIGSQSSHNRRQSAVSVAKGQTGTLPIPVAGAGSRESINFGSIAEGNALLSSSPATRPEAIRPPKQFGSVEAANPEAALNGPTGSSTAGADAAASANQKASGANPARADSTSSGTPAVRTAKQTVNFHKLFQNNASSAASTPATASASTATSATGESSRATSTAPSTVSQTPSSSATTTPAPSTQNTPAHTPAPQNATPSPGPRMPSSNLRPSGSQPFQPASRAPSGAHTGPGSRLPSGAPGNVPPSPFVPHNQQQQSVQGQVQRSPSVQNAGLQPMHMPQQSWMPMYPGGQYPGYHPQYPYQGPGGWQQPHQGYDMQNGGPGAPRSPRHPHVSTSPMPPGSHQLNGAPAASPMHSPGQTRSQAAGPGAIGLGQPPTPHNRPPSFPSVGSGTFVPHGHSHGHAHSGSQHGSFSGTSGPQTPVSGGVAPMSPSARNFEPKRSSAIKIVNPATKTALDISGLAPKSASVSKFLANASGSASSTTPTSSAAPSPVPAAAVPAKPKTHENFMEMVKARAAAGKALAGQADEEKEKEKKEKEEAERKAKEEADRKAEEEQKAKEEAEQKAKEEAERKAKEEAERQAKEAEEARRKAEEEAKAKAAAEEEAKRKTAEEEAKRKAEEEAKRKQKEEEEAAAKKRKEEEEAAAAAAAAADASTSAEDKAKETTPSRPVPKPIDTKSSTRSVTLSTADIERLAREASSVPSTPHEGLPPRTPGLPLATPRTPSTPGFAGLPAKPLASMTNSTSSGSIASISNTSIKLDAEALERKKRPIISALDVSAANKVRDDGPLSAASVSLGSARKLVDLTSVDYGKLLSPKPELNKDADPGKYRYDRDFLLQFMDVVRDKPPTLPSLATLGMDNASIGGGMPPRTGSGRRASGIVGGPGSALGRVPPAGLGISGGPGSAFGNRAGAPLRTSEERFAASNAGRPGPGGMGSFGSGPMGAFNVANRSQPLSRGGSGSNAIPGRDDGGRSKSTRGRQREPNPSRGDRGPPVNPPEKGGPTIPMDQVVPLANSENRWVPQAGAGRSSALKADSPEMVQRKVKALLNKLTLEKFDSISTQILEWANKSINETDGRTLRQVIALIFEKATDEAAFSEMYARLCQKIYGELNPEISDANLKDANGNAVSGGPLFRKYLLNRCQEDFERGWAARESSKDAAKSKEAEDKAKKERNEAAEAEAKAAEERGEAPKTTEKETELLSDEYYEMAKAKRRGLGLVRFIGELCKKAMLTERIMHLCVKQLLSNTTDPDEEDIESLCKLLTTVGQMMDSPKYSGLMDIYFQRMQDIVDSGKINSRMRFMLIDVIELREKQHWVPRHAQANTGPKTIAQVHEEAKAQAAAKEAEAYNRSRGGPVSRGGSRRGQPRDGFGGPAGIGPGGDGWNTVGGGPPAQPPPRAKAGDLSGFGSITRTNSKGPLFGGPSTAFGKRNKGPSEDGSTPPTRTNSSSNMFALLGHTEDTDGTAAPSQAEEKGRPKLQLAPRTLPLPDQDAAPADKADDDEDDGKDDEDDDDEDEEPQPPASMTDDEAEKRITNDVKEFLAVKDIKSGVTGFKLLPQDRRGQAVASFVTTAIEQKEADVQNVTKLLQALNEEQVCSEEQLADGFKDTMPFLQDFQIDMPNVFSWIAGMLVAAGFSQERIESMADTIENEDNASPPPKEKLLAKVNERRSA